MQFLHLAWQLHLKIKDSELNGGLNAALGCAT